MSNQAQQERRRRACDRLTASIEKYKQEIATVSSATKKKPDNQGLVDRLATLEDKLSKARTTLINTRERL